MHRLVESVQLEPSPLTAGDSVTVRVTLSPPSPFSKTRMVKLTHSGLVPTPGVPSPILLTVPMGQNTAARELYVAPLVASPASVTASFNGTSKTTTVTIQPRP